MMRCPAKRSGICTARQKPTTALGVRVAQTGLTRVKGSNPAGRAAADTKSSAGDSLRNQPSSRRITGSETPATVVGTGTMTGRSP